MAQGSGPEYLLSLALMFTPNLGGLLLNVFLCIFLPGAKGNITAERTHFFEGHAAEKVREHLQKRLLADKFRLVNTGDATVLKAERLHPRPAESIMASYAFRGTKLLAEVHFQPHAKGAAVHMRVTTKDFILLDSGETNYLQAMLDFLQLKPVIRTLPPSLNGKSYMAMINSIVGAMMPVLLAAGWPAETRLVVLVAICVGCFSTFILALMGTGEILIGGGKYKGLAMAFAAMAIALGTVAVSVFINFFST